jgi:hypothetical protein
LLTQILKDVWRNPVLTGRYESEWVKQEESVTLNLFLEFPLFFLCGVFPNCLVGASMKLSVCASICLSFCLSALSFDIHFSLSLSLSDLLMCFPLVWCYWEYRKWLVRVCTQKSSTEEILVRKLSNLPL